MTTALIVSGLALALCAASANVHAADPCVARSGSRTLPLVELYTSEGCNSCPPADRWLAKSFVPAGDGPAAVLAFHVDYWDRLGWPDRFARPAWSARQQAIAQAGRSAVVYTPQVLLQGRDTTAWHGSEALRDVARAASAPARATISLAANVVDRRVSVEARADVAAPAERAGTRLVVAYTDGGHRTEVRRGENAGVTLAHEYVVRTLVTSDAPDATGTLALATSFELPAEAGAHPRLVAFVERHAARDVLQSLVLPFERCGR